jgi:hypothetical protein
MRINDGGSGVYTLPPPPPPQKQNTSQSVDVTTTVHATSATTMTPQQRVDAAVAKYDAAVKGGDKTAIAQAQQEVYAAVRGEVAPQVDQANANIPPQYRTPTDPQMLLQIFTQNVIGPSGSTLLLHPNRLVARWLSGKIQCGHVNGSQKPVRPLVLVLERAVCTAIS